MIHEKYNSLPLKDKWIFTGELLHAVMHKEQYFLIAMSVIESAKKEGLFDNIEIMPEREKSPLLMELGEALKPEVFNDVNL